MVEQPSILSSLRSPLAAAPPGLGMGGGGLGGLGMLSLGSPSEERSPDAVSSASEATETGGSMLLFINLWSIAYW